MWRLLLVVVGIGMLGSACSREQSVEEDFVQRMEQLKEATFTVTYDYDVMSDLEEPDVPVRPITWYRANEFGRTDHERDPEATGEMSQFTAVQGPVGSYRCSEVPTSVTYGLAGCVLEPTNGGVFVASPPRWLQIAIARPHVLAVERLEDRTLAGVTTRCFDVEADSGDGSDMEVCLTSDGIPLYIEIPIPNIDSRVVFTATSVSDEVPADIFLPPMEVVGASPLCSGPNALGNCGPQDKE